LKGRSREHAIRTFVVNSKDEGGTFTVTKQICVHDIVLEHVLHSEV